MLDEGGEDLAPEGGVAGFGGGGNAGDDVDGCHEADDGPVLAARLGGGDEDACHFPGLDVLRFQRGGQEVLGYELGGVELWRRGSVELGFFALQVYRGQRPPVIEVDWEQDRAVVFQIKW